tara:strand:+ start:937 stop:1380 length:444 start_codon:yes stop_codon:yes gene_type:complete
MDKFMKNGIFIFAILQCLFAQNKTSPSEFWNSYSQEEKIAFINGAYGAISKLKSHHKSEVKKQYIHDDNWVEPYYIERFYSIADEYLAQEIGYNIKIIALHIDAFYTNSDNLLIPTLEALRIVSLMQDGENGAANLRLLRAQQKFNN